MCDINKVLRIASKKEPTIDTSGKNLIMFLGISQNGKSTTINEFLGANYELTDEEPPKLKMGNSGISGAAIGDGTGKSCTVLPGLYRSNDSSSYYFDIQGYGNTDKNKIFEGEELNADEIEVIASILTEMSIKKASSVKLVLVIKYDNIKDGIKGMQETCDMLKHYLKYSAQIPIFLLFNRYNSDSQKRLIDFYQKSGNEKMNYLYDLLKPKINGMNNCSSNQKNMEFWGIIKQNFDQRNCAYIDFDDKSYISSIKNRINNFQSCDKKSIILNNTSQSRANFNKLMEDKLDEYCKLLTYYHARQVCPTYFFDKLKKDISNSIQTLTKEINKFDNSNKYQYNIKEITKEIKEEELIVNEFETKEVQLDYTHWYGENSFHSQERTYEYKGHYTRYSHSYGRETHCEKLINKPSENYFYARYKADLGFFNWSPIMNVTIIIYGYERYKYPLTYQSHVNKLNELKEDKSSILSDMNSKKQELRTKLYEQKNFLDQIKEKQKIIEKCPFSNPTSLESESIIKISQKLEVNGLVIVAIENIKEKIEKESSKQFEYVTYKSNRYGHIKTISFTNHLGKSGDSTFFMDSIKELLKVQNRMYRIYNCPIYNFRYTPLKINFSFLKK